MAHLDALGKFGHFGQISPFWAILNNNLTNSLFLCQIFGSDSDQFSLGLEAKLISDDLVLKSTLCVFESLQAIVYHVAPTVHICQWQHNSHEHMSTNNTMTNIDGDI